MAEKFIINIIKPLWQRKNLLSILLSHFGKGKIIIKIIKPLGHIKNINYKKCFNRCINFTLYVWSKYRVPLTIRICITSIPKDKRHIKLKECTNQHETNTCPFITCGVRHLPRKETWAAEGILQQEERNTIETEVIYRINSYTERTWLLEMSYSTVKTHKFIHGKDMID